MSKREEIPQADEDRQRGRDARQPSEIPGAGWKDVLWRTYSEVAEDRVTMVAAGATYYLLLAMFPALGVLVSLYGLIADPAAIERQVDMLAGVVPAGGLEIVRTQLRSLAAPKDSTLGIMLVASLLIALWSANNGMKALFEAMNIAYGEEEKRGFFRLNLLSLAFTACGLAAAVAILVLIGVVPAVLAFMRLDGWAEALVKWIRWPVLLGLFVLTTSVIFRYGPSRETAKWRWVTWGASLSAVSWILMSIGFSYYLENFANYNASYGTLGALVGFMMWVWLSVTILIVGAELNAELEHQTKCDSTTGAPLPMGERGAVMADTLGESVK